MKKSLPLLLVLLCLLALLAACTGETPAPQIRPMSLTADQQEIVDFLSSPIQEILLFEYNLGEDISHIEVWVEVYHYGERIDQPSALWMFSDTQFPFSDGPMAIIITQPADNQFQWTISFDGSSSTGMVWTAEHSHTSRGFGPIIEAVEIIDGQEILLYISRFTSRNSMNTMGDLQWYLEHPEALAGFTYVHLIKARFTS